MEQPCSAFSSLKSPPNHLPNFRRRGKLITEEVLRGNCGDLAAELRHRPDPSACRQLTSRALDELRMWQAHVRGEMDNLASLYHDQHRVPVTHLNFLAHRVADADLYYTTAGSYIEMRLKPDSETCKRLIINQTSLNIRLPVRLLKAQTHAQCLNCFPAYPDNLAERQKGAAGNSVATMLTRGPASLSRQSCLFRCGI